MNTRLILGDILAIGILTVIGFASHGEAGLAFIPRMGTTFFPVLLGWFLTAPAFGLFDEQVTADLKHLWRILPAMLLCAPFAVILRAVLLGTHGVPLFTLILGSSFGLGMLIWRAIHTGLIRPGSR